MEEIGLSALFDLTAWDKGIDNYLKDVKRAENETQGMAGKLGKAYDSMGKSVLGAATTMGKTFVAAAAAATVAVGAFVANGIKGAMDLESQMGAIAATMGETKDAVGPLKDLIMDLGLDPTLKVNATEAADAIEKLASNGLTMTQIMEGAAKNTVLLANSTGADFDTAAAIATDTMALFNIEAKDMMDAVNGITGVTVSSKFTINDYRLALSQAGGVASAAGVNFDDFNTSITGISNYFASGSDAGTSFKTMLLRLVPSTDAASVAMDKLGLVTFDSSAAMKLLEAGGVKPLSDSTQDLTSQLYGVWAATHKTEASSDTAMQKFSEWQHATGVLSNAFYDANGNMKDMSEVSVLLNGALKGLTEEEKSKALNTIFGTDAMRAAVGMAEQGEVVYTDQALAAKELGVSFESLSGIMDGGITKFEAMQIAIGKTSAADAAKVRMDNFKGSLEILQGVIETVGLQIGFAFLPVLKQLADRASELITQYAPMITSFFESFAAGIEKIVNGAGWREVFPLWLTGAIDVLAQNMNALIGAIGGIALMLASSAIGPAITAIATAIGTLNPYMLALIAVSGLLGAAWNSNFLGMKDATFAALDAITKAFEPLTTAIQEFGSGAITEITNFVTGNETEFTNLKAIWDGAVESVQNLFTAIVTTVTANLPLWKAQLVEWGAAAWGWIVEASGIAVTRLGEWATALVGALAANLPTIIATLIEWSAALVTWITDAIAGGITMLGTWASALVGWITGEGKTQIGGGALALVGALIDWIANDLIPKVAPAMGEFSAALAGGIVKIAAAMGIDAVKIATAIVDAIMKTDYQAIGINILTLIRDGWNATVSAVTTVVTTFVDGIKNKFTEVDWKSIGTAVLTYIKDGFSAVVGTAITVITTFASSIKLKFTEIDWKAIGSSILTFIKDGINAMATGVLTALGAIVTSLKDKFSDTVNNWTATGKDILDKVRTGIESAKTTTLATITTIVADMKQRYVTPDGFAWNTIGGDISNAIRDGLQTAAKAAGGILAAVTNVATFIKDQFTDQSWSEIGQSIIDGIKRGVDEASKAADGLITAVKNMGLDLAKSFTEIDWSGIGRSIATFLKDGFKALAEGAGGLLPTVKGTGQGMLDAFKDVDWLALGKDILGGILTGVKAIAYGGGGMIYIVAEIVKGFTEELFGVDWQEQGQKIIQNIQAGIEAAKSKFMEIVKGIPTGIKQIFTDMTQEFKNIGTAIVDGIGSGITGAKDTLMKKAQDLANALPGWVKEILGISSPSKVFAEIGRNIVQGLIAGIDDTTGELNKVISALFGGLSGDQIGAVNINVSDQFAQRAEDIIKPIQQQLEAMESLNDLEATRLGLMHKIGVAQEGITDSSQLPTETLDQIAKWTEELETANQSIATRLKLQRDLESLQGLDSSVQELRARQDSISLLEDYLSLLESAGTLGIDISRYDVIPGDTVGTLQSMVDLESKIAIIRNEQLKLQSTGLRQTLQERKALQERELAEKKLAEDRANGLKIAMQQLQPLIDSLSISTTYGKKYQASVLDPILAKLKDVAEVEGERSRLVAEYYQSSKQLQSLQYFQNEVSDFSTRIDLLKQAADLGIDISGYAVSYDNSINGLMEMVALEEKVARAKITQLQTQGGLIKQEQARVNGLRLAMDQLSGAMGAVGAVSAAFAQRLKAQYLDPIIEKLQTAAGIDSERVRLVNEYLSASQQFAWLRFFEARAARMGDYVSLLSEAKDLGIDISNTPNFIGTDKDSLLKVVKLEEEVAKARFAQLVAQAGQIRQQQQLTAALKPWVDAVNRVETYNDHLSEQLGLMKKAEGLGMNLLDVWNRYITFDPNDQKRVLEFQQKIAEASRQDLMNQMTGMIAEQKRVKGLESALSQLQPLIDQTNVSSAFGQKYKAEVLDPMLRALEKSAGIDSERVRLMNEYTAAAQKLIEINKKEGQLDFLKQQLDVIKMIKDQDLVGGNSLFDGIAFGVNASIDDLLTLTNRVLNAMITEVKDELGIHSPSQVFADIGGQMMAGLQQGIQKGFMQPLNALRQGTVAHGSMSTRTLNFAMGGVTINTPMDEVMFESRVLRILERSMN